MWRWFGTVSRDVTYFKRLRMEIDLSRLPAIPPLPRGLEWIGWSRRLCSTHADVKYRCFHGELDSRVFPCLGDREGCRRLMREISARQGFLPEATWLLIGPEGHLGTVQGVREPSGIGMIQNLGIVPEARGRGLGRALLLKSLHGFRLAGLRRGMLEVTADNVPAVRLYRTLGFRRSRTLYKAVENTQGEAAPS